MPVEVHSEKSERHPVPQTTTEIFDMQLSGAQVMFKNEGQGRFLSPQPIYSLKAGGQPNLEGGLKKTSPKNTGKSRHFSLLASEKQKIF
jgi:hypothetical protein